MTETNRFRARLFLRNLVMIVQLVGEYFDAWYFDAWSLTRKYGVPAPHQNWSAPVTVEGEVRIERADSPAPMIIRQDEVEYKNVAAFGPPPRADFPRRYYLWLFGPKVRLPIESEWRPFGGPAVYYVRIFGVKKKLPFEIKW